MPNVADGILDEITGHSVDLVRAEAGQRKQVLRQLKKLERSLIKQIEAADIGSVKTTKFRLKRMETLLGHTRNTIRSTYSSIANKQNTQLKSMAKVAEHQAIGTINTALRVDVLSVGMSKEFISEIAKNTLIQNAPSREWWMRQSGSLVLGFKDIIRNGALQGHNTHEMVQRIRGTKAHGFKDGIMETSRRKAEALVRTSIQTVANEARLQTYKNNNDIIKGIEFVSTLDGRTTQKCRALDGLKWDLDGAPIGHDVQRQIPPVHWNCRSTTVPITKTWEELGAKGKFKEISSSTRASMGGQVSAGLTYEDWLRTRPEEKQKEILGVGKWKLWNANKIGFTDLVDQRGNELTLTELEKETGIFTSPTRAEVLTEDEYQSLASQQNEETDDELRQSIQTYMGAGHGTLNAKLYREEELPEYLETLAKNLDVVMEPVPVEFMVLRGYDGGKFNPRKASKTFISTTRLEDFVLEKKSQVALRVNKGTKGIFPAEAVGELPLEREFLIGRGATIEKTKEEILLGDGTLVPIFSIK